jgi:hypothetical protein
LIRCAVANVQGALMLDVIYLVLMAALFASSVAMIRFFDRL